MSQLPAPSRTGKAAEWYDDATWLRALVTAVPYLGGSLDLILSARGQRLAQQRAGAMLSALGDEMRRLDEQAVRKEYLESEEWTDLVRLALERSSRVRSKERVRAIARVLSGAVTGQIASTSHSEVLIDTLAELREEEAQILRALYVAGTGVRPDDTTPNEEPAGVPADALGLPVEFQGRAQFLLARLERAGIVSPGLMTVEGTFEGKYRLTDAGSELCMLVQAEGDAPSGDA